MTGVTGLAIVAAAENVVLVVAFAVIWSDLRREQTRVLALRDEVLRLRKEVAP